MKRRAVTHLDRVRKALDSQTETAHRRIQQKLRTKKTRQDVSILPRVAGHQPLISDGELWILPSS